MVEDLHETAVDKDEVVLPVTESGDSPTSDKKPLKLRFSPMAGKRLNPAVQVAVACLIICFVMLLAYGIMSKSQKKRAVATSPDEKRTFVDAGQTGAQVWQDMQDQRKNDALKASQPDGSQNGDQRFPMSGAASNSTTLQPGTSGSATVPNDLVARNASSGVVPPLVAHTLVPPGRDGKGNPVLVTRTRPIAGQVAYSSNISSGKRTAAQEWRDQMYKSEMAARGSSTSISGRDSSGSGGVMGAISNAVSNGPASALAQLVDRYTRGGGSSSSTSVPTAGGDSQSDSDNNMQQHKEGFIERAREGRVEHDYSSATRMRPLTKYEIKAGWDIPATLESAVNTDLPGEVKAVVRQNVYDTATGRYLLIPQGSRLIGRYDNRVSYGQTRAIVIWSRLIFPDGSSVDLDGMIGHDASGAAGFHDKVDNHYVRLVSMALMLSAFTAGIEMSQPQSNSTTGYLTPSQQATQALGQQFGQLGIEVSRKNLSIQPTIKVRIGYRFNVRVNRDIAFAEPYSGGR
jgi:type IV secretion system protein TrbI